MDIKIYLCVFLFTRIFVYTHSTLHTSYLISRTVCDICPLGTDSFHSFLFLSLKGPPLILHTLSPWAVCWLSLWHLNVSRVAPPPTEALSLPPSFPLLMPLLSLLQTGLLLNDEKAITDPSDTESGLSSLTQSPCSHCYLLPQRSPLCLASDMCSLSLHCLSACSLCPLTQRLQSPPLLLLPSASFPVEAAEQASARASPLPPRSHCSTSVPSLGKRHHLLHPCQVSGS